MARINRGPALADRSDTTVNRPIAGLDRQLLAVFLIALAVRLVYFLTIRSEPYYQVPLLDSAWYHRSALEILRDGFWGKDVFFRGPLYSYFVALCYRLFGENPEAPKMIQLLLGAGTCTLLTAAARQCFDRRTALISGIVAALYPTLVFFDGELLATGPASFLGVLLLHLVLSADRQSTPRRWLAAGVILGLGAITRPTILFFGAGVAVWLLRSRSRRGRPLIALLAGAAIVIAPVTLRNAVVGGEFIPIASQGGVNFYMGNNPAADGKSAILPGWSEKSADWISFENDTRRMAEVETGHPLSAAGESLHWTRKAFAFVGGHPWKASGLFARKIYFLLNGFEIPNNKDLYFFKQYSPVLNLTLWKRGFAFPGGILIPLAAVGLLLSAARPREMRVFHLFLLCQTLAIILFFVSARFRVAILPALIPFAVWGAGQLAGKVRSGPRSAGQLVWKIRSGLHSTGPVFSLIGIAFLALSNSNFLGVGDTARWQDYYDLGLVHVQRGNYTQAETAFREARRLKSNEVSVIYNLGLVRMSLGNLENAASLFTLALSLDPGMTAARNNLGMALGRMGRLDEAEREFRKILEQDPNHAQALANLRLIEQMRRDAP